MKEVKVRMRRSRAVSLVVKRLRYWSSTPGVSPRFICSISPEEPRDPWNPHRDPPRGS